MVAKNSTEQSFTDEIITISVNAETPEIAQKFLDHLRAMTGHVKDKGTAIVDDRRGGSGFRYATFVYHL